MSPQPHLQRIMEHRVTLSREQARDLMHQVFLGELSEIEIAALTGALSARGETAAEVAGFVDSMRAAATPLPLTEVEKQQLVDTCGTGGDASGTFNISTAAALVAAAAGATVAKHGNRAVTSRCGSADVLEALGIPVGLDPAQAAEALRRHRFAFLHAPSLHPAMKAVLPVRRALGIRTVFNILGPLTNPAGASAQVMGVYAPHLVPLVAEAMALLGTRHAFVVHGDEGDQGGLDELSISGPSLLAEVRTTPGATSTVTLSTIAPEEFGLTRAPLESLTGGNAIVNAEILRAIFAGHPGPQRDVVLLNAAAVLVTAGLSPDLAAGIQLAASTIDEGKVTELVADLSRTD
ncbi:MAG: anthranilate phosphoribosyltransferase [Acidobacteriaceae bacterium]|nr:anthranilate phosphoribosyltransferase [Acidobacteriaceae bacterium]